MIFATAIADILEKFAGCDSLIMGDVTYGACCVDDLTAKALGAQLMVHYGHSCLVPVDAMTAGLKMLYVFVDIQIDLDHFIETVRFNFPLGGKVRRNLRRNFDEIYAPIYATVLRGSTN